MNNWGGDPNLDLLVEEKEVDLFAESGIMITLIGKWEIILW